MSLPLVKIAAGVLALFLVAGGRTVFGQAEQAGDRLHTPQDFVGVWDYNAEHSINIVTGRPEQNPRGAPPPRNVLAPRVAPPPAQAGDVPQERETPFSPSVQAIREARDMARDLLEVPETLAFDIADTSVTITDDLERVRTYPTDGSRGRYRLGASEFSARVRWEDGRLRRDIEGTFGFRISETYFLSDDANRLFVIVRVGEPGRGRRAPGFDRVYDRVADLQP
jgi:hypothetical protein